MPAMAVALLPSPLSTSSSQSTTDAHFLAPLQNPIPRSTSSDKLSASGRRLCSKRASKLAGEVSFSSRQHHPHTEEATGAGDAEEIVRSLDNLASPDHASEGTFPQDEHEEDARVSPNQEELRTSFQHDSVNRQIIVDYLSQSTFDLAEGMLLHSLLIESGFELQTFEWNVLVHMYGNFGALPEAHFMFHQMQRRNVISWNTLMSAYMNQNCFPDALELFVKMHEQDSSPDSTTITIALRSCAGLITFSKGRLIHYFIVSSGFETGTDVATALILMYGRCGAWREAHFVFQNMPDRDEFAWTTMILACFDHGRHGDTLQLYRQMYQERRAPNKVILITALKCCIHLRDLGQGKLIHKYIAMSAFASDQEVTSVLVTMYGECRAPDLACLVFENMTARTVASYNTVLAAYLSKGLYKKAFQAFQRMLEDGFQPDAATYSKAVHACEYYVALEDVRKIYFHVIKFGLDSDSVMATAMLGMYCKCGQIAEARFVLSKMNEREILSWNTLLAACMQHRRPHDCIQIFEEMLRDGNHLTKETFAYVLPSCALLGALENGKILHACIVEAELELDSAMGSALLNMYGKCGSLKDARCVFDKIRNPDVIHWTSMIAVYVQHGRATDALHLFEKMQQERVRPNCITFTNVLNACASLGALSEGQMIHVRIKDSELKADAGLANALLHMYCKCGALTEARLVFEDMAHKKAVSWNVLIAAYIEHNQFEVAIKLFHQMQQEMVEADEITFLSIVRACAGLEDLDLGMKIHSSVVQRGLGSDIFFATSLIRMYGACGALEEAHWVFDGIEKHNIVSWTSIISVYAQQGCGQEAIELFHQMKVEGWEPDGVTLVSVLGAYANLKLAAPEDVVQACLKCNLESDVLLGNALINMYAKCSDVESGISIFEKMRKRNVVTWNAMISAYGQHGYGKEALALLQSAHQEGISPDELTWCHCLGICADMGALGQGKSIHRGIINCGYEANIGLGNALVSMYGKCGAMEEAFSVFNTMQRDVVSWNAIITAFSQHGHVGKVVKLFRQMLVEGLKPDEVTFLSVLNACSHAGLIKEGREFFIWMRDRNKSVLKIFHYGCLIDLFGKSGHLDVAEDLICTVPVYTTSLLWMTLLGSCRNHGDMKRGERAMNYVARLDPGNGAPYVLMSNIYATHGKWDDVKMLREAMLTRRIQKRPGCSVIEVDNEVHSFLPRDRRHPDRHAIYRKLKILNRQLEARGYVPDTRLALQDVNEERKKFLMCHHSERLALAYGLIRTPFKEPLLIVKNLRMCTDCHAAFKFFSTIVDRKITVRDAGRFHLFEKGLCSCRDYW